MTNIKLYVSRLISSCTSRCILFFILLFSFLVLSCRTNNQPLEAINTANETLPYFNTPDWTPEWIEKTDSQYQKIHQIPAFNFKDQEGNAISNKTVNGKIYIANFFFTSCRGICPKMTSNMYLLQEAFKLDTSILFLSHSVTPDTDSVAVLKKYAIENGFYVNEGFVSEVKITEDNGSSVFTKKVELNDLEYKSYLLENTITFEGLNKDGFMDKLYLTLNPYIVNDLNYIILQMSLIAIWGLIIIMIVIYIFTKKRISKPLELITKSINNIYNQFEGSFSR